MDGRGRIIPKQDDPEWKFQTDRGTNLAYDMLYEPISSDNEEKDGYNISGNRLIKLRILTTKFFSVPTMCTGEGSTDEIKIGKRPGKPHFLR